MAATILAFPRPKPAKTRLVRGIDAIPDHFEFLSAYDAIRSLSRSVRTLRRLASESAAAGRKRDAAALRRCLGAVENAADSISGGFDVSRMKKLTARYRGLVDYTPPGVT